jgi:hypothetical protein
MLMTVVLVGVGNAAFALASLILGIRLCILARRTRQLPELLLGIGFITGGFMGHLLATIVYGFKPAEPLLTVLHYCLRAGAATACGLLFVMALVVFRPTERWAKVVAALFLPILFTYILRDLVLGRGPNPAHLRHPIYWVHALAMWFPYVWLTVESYNYQARLRRQWDIGLPADLGLAARMRFWAVGMGAIGCMLISMDVIKVVNVVYGAMLMDPRLIISALGLICTASLWMAFFPPRAYMRRIDTEAAAARAVA